MAIDGKAAKPIDEKSVQTTIKELQVPRSSGTASHDEAPGQRQFSALGFDVVATAAGSAAHLCCDCDIAAMVRQCWHVELSQSTMVSWSTWGNWPANSFTAIATLLRYRGFPTRPRLHFSRPQIIERVIYLCQGSEKPPSTNSLLGRARMQISTVSIA